MKKTMFAVFCCATLMAGAQTEVTVYKPGVTLEGVCYALPKTALQVVVTAEKTTFVPGELAKYSERYLHQTPGEKDVCVRWRLLKTMIKPYGVADVKKIYNIALRSKTIAPLVTLMDDGRIVSIHKEVEAKDEMLSVPAPVVSAVKNDVSQYMTADMLRASSKAKLAELVAQEIYDIRESRNALLRGEADNTPKDGAQLQLMLDGLNAQEAALMSLFMGTKEISQQSYELRFVPEGECKNQILARFGREVGLVDADDLSGAPIYIDVEQLEQLPAEDENPDTAKKRAKMTTGIYYNVPVRSSVTVRYDNEVRSREEIMMAQMGRVEVLSDALFNKNVTTKVHFSPVTGGVVKIEE